MSERLAEPGCRRTYRFLQKPEYPHRLQEVIQIVMEVQRWFCGVHIWMKLFGISLDEWWLLESCVCLKVSEADEIVESDG